MKSFILALLFILLSICASAQNNKPYIVRKIYTNKNIYTFGDKVIITIRAINTSATQDTLIFPDLCDAYPFVDGKDYLATFSLGCFTGISKRVIPSKDSIEWTKEYPYNNKIENMLPVGQHTLFGYFRGVCPNSDTIVITVKQNPNIVGNEPIKYDYSLFQNYPNPFNPSTLISFSLKNETFVSIVIYNQLGQELETLINSDLPEGNHTITWSPKNISAGIYYYKIVTAKYSETKKLIYAK